MARILTLDYYTPHLVEANERLDEILGGPDIAIFVNWAWDVWPGNEKNRGHSLLAEVLVMDNGLFRQEIASFYGEPVNENDYEFAIPCSLQAVGLVCAQYLAHVLEQADERGKVNPIAKIYFEELIVKFLTVLFLLAPLVLLGLQILLEPNNGNQFRQKR